MSENKILNDSEAAETETRLKYLSTSYIIINCVVVPLIIDHFCTVGVTLSLLKRVYMRQ